MPHPSRLALRSIRTAGLLIAAVPILALAADNDSKSKPVPSGEAGYWSIASRNISEGRAQGRYWQVDYLLRNEGAAARSIRPEDLSAVVVGTVSNSRVPGHACPRASRLTVSGSSGLSTTCDVIPSGDESRRCRERAVLQVWPADKGHEPPDPVAKASVRLVSLSEQPTPTIAPGATLRVRLRLEHDHFLYGPYDPLLGPRTVELSLGGVMLKDTLALDRETKLPRAASGPWPGFQEPPADRLDARVYVSAPNSLHLEAHVPGNQSFRLRECPVRYGTRMRLRYWYLIAPGSEGEGKAVLVQYREAPAAWKILADGDIRQTLTTVGRWVKVEKVFRTESEATSLTLEFQLSGDMGEMWVDDVSLEPVEDEAERP